MGRRLLPAIISRCTAFAMFLILTGSPASGQFFYVAPSGNDAADGLSWATAKRTVQAGINVAGAGEYVLVATGRYIERISLKQGVGLYGGFAGTEDPYNFDPMDRNLVVNETILDGNQAGSVVVVPAGAGTDTALDGFTVRNGTGTLFDSVLCGGGVYCRNASPTIANNRIIANRAVDGAGVYVAGGTSCVIAGNTISENNASYHGGGVHLSGGSTSPLLEVNTITENHAISGAGIYVEDASPRILTNVISRNKAGGDGGGLYLYAAVYTSIEHNQIEENAADYEGGGLDMWFCYSVNIRNNRVFLNQSKASGAGFYVAYTSPALIASNRVDGNAGVGQGGGVYAKESSLTIACNAFLGNTGVDGGGLFSDASSLRVVNNTFTNNVGMYGGPMLFDGGTSVIANNIVAFNCPGMSRFLTHPTLTFRNNLVYGNASYNYRWITDPTGTSGNISVDPQLADVRHGNVHVQPGSPCINAGNNADLMSDWMDMDHEARTQGGVVDIGADETDGRSWAPGPYAVVHVSPQGNDSDDGLDWVTAKRTVQAGINSASKAGGEVWVAAGLYPERIRLNAYTYLFGGFAGNEELRGQRDWAVNQTTLDGQAGGSVVVVSSGYHNSSIDGFTISNGTGGACGLDSGTQGGGVCCFLSAPTIANNIIVGNTAARGGGLYVYASPTLVNNTIIRNEATLEGGGMWCRSSVICVNNTIVGNDAPSAGGVQLSVGTPLVANTIIAYNSSGVAKLGGTPVWMHNCVYGNVEYDYSEMTDPTGVDGNLSVAPGFVEADAGPDGQWATADDRLANFRLRYGSPCIDAGRNDQVPVDTDDLDADGNVGEATPFDGTGKSRFVDDPNRADSGNGSPPLVDIGAYEYFPTLQADFNYDGQVDSTDAQSLLRCAMGPSISYRTAPASGCTLLPGDDGVLPADFDQDDDVDSADFGFFQRFLGGFE